MHDKQGTTALAATEKQNLNVKSTTVEQERFGLYDAGTNDESYEDHDYDQFPTRTGCPASTSSSLQSTAAPPEGSSSLAFVPANSIWSLHIRSCSSTGFSKTKCAYEAGLNWIVRSICNRALMSGSGIDDHTHTACGAGKGIRRSRTRHRKYLIITLRQFGDD